MLLVIQTLGRTTTVLWTLRPLKKNESKRGVLSCWKLGYLGHLEAINEERQWREAEEWAAWQQQQMQDGKLELALWASFVSHIHETCNSLCYHSARGLPAAADVAASLDAAADDGAQVAQQSMTRALR